MSGSFEKSVKGGTKIKLAPPKAKYVEHILVATHAGDAGVAEIFRALQNRLRDSTWTIVFKSLIIVHLMIREGEPNVTLRYLADQPSKLAISNFTDVQIQGTNIRHYYTYVLARARAYRDTKIDWVREGTGRLKRQTVDKGLLRETEAVQNQISNLLRCDLLSTEAENEITVCAFRLLTMDLLVLYGVMNEGTINVLEHYFEMSKFDAQRALAIYKTFAKQTNLVVEFLGTARHYENATRLEIPKLKHAPTSLTASLEEYLNDPDFEVNRRQYLAQQDAKKGKKPAVNGGADTSHDFKKAAINSGGATSKLAEKAPQIEPPAKKSPAPDLIDFFESIEQNQQPMTVQKQQQPPNLQNGQLFSQQQPQQTGFMGQQDFFAPYNQQPQAQQLNAGAPINGNPYGQTQTQQSLQQNFIGAGFGDYTAQPQPQLSFSQQQQDIFSNNPQNNGIGFSQQQQPFSPGQPPFLTSQPAMHTGQQAQTSNPFRQSMYPQATGASMPTHANTFPIASPLSAQSTNPFARNMPNQTTEPASNSPFSSKVSGTPFTSTPPVQAHSTPLNSPPPPIPQQQIAPQLTPQRTGTNPFARTPTQSQSQPQSATQSQFSPAQPLVASATGSNPFRQSMFVNQQTGQGWQTGQGTMGGLEQLPTMPVFPRPGEQHQQPNLWE